MRQSAVASAMLDPLRIRLMEALAEPTSATQLGRVLGQPRQKINYHLRELERAGLVRLVEERKRGNCVERIVAATATSYLISPEALGAISSEPGKVADRASSAYLLAVAAEAIREVAVLRERALEAGKKLATLTMQAQVRFESPEAMNRFAEELTAAVAEVVARHNAASEAHPEGRVFKLVVGAYPAVTCSEGREQTA